MRRTSILSSESFGNEFIRCCQKYESLDIAVAWCGNPNRTLPYNYIENFKGKVSATIGVSFYHTHPDAFSWLIELGANVRIFKDEIQLFHPKIYLFENKDEYAVFIGSSNLTYAGFYSNIETNCLIEGIYNSDGSNDIRLLKNNLDLWETDEFSISLTDKWLRNYRKNYETHSKNNKDSPSNRDEKVSAVDWLRRADWDNYYKKVREGLSERKGGGQGYYNVLEKVPELIPTPWRSEYFGEIEKRRIIGGIGQYDWFGHVAANGRFRGLLANGTTNDYATIVTSINAIASLQQPLPFGELLIYLKQLISLGPSMLVWSRILCITRPDLYCTVSSESVREYLSETLNISKNSFKTPEGYIELIKLIHTAPWFNSSPPKQEPELATWKYRAALLDAIFH